LFFFLDCNDQLFKISGHGCNNYVPQVFSKSRCW
jgi:hypothetical protein